MTSEKGIKKLKPEEAVAEAVADDQERLHILAELARKIEDEFCQRAKARLPKEAQWRECIRLYGSPLVGSDYFNPDRPFERPSGRRRPVPNIVRTKCDTAIANSVSMQFAAGEKNWDLWPPANDPSPETAVRCKKMELEIQTQLDDCGYALQCRRGMGDRVILGTGVVKGPVNTGKLRTKYVQSGSIWIPELVEDKAPAIEHVSVWNFYPDMSVTRHADSDSDIQLHSLTAFDMSMLRRNRGFDADQILEIIKTPDLYGPEKYNSSRYTTITTDMWNQPHMYKERHTVLEFHGPVSYDTVKKLGLTPSYESPTSEYYGEVWVSCGKVIRMELENIEGACETPYAVSVWKEDPSSPFGFGHPLLLADAQQVITQTYHMILDNASLTSGPQISMYQQFIQPADKDWTVRPNKVWLLTDPTVKINDAIQFFTPQNVIGNIMPVLELARMFAEEESATTAMAAGLQSPGVSDSATGQLVMERNSTVLLDFLSEEWDDAITNKVIRRMFGWNMQYNPKEDIKGDFKIDVRSSSEYKNKLMHIRDLEKLSVEASQNPNLAVWVNMDELQKARLNLMTLPSNRIIKTQEQYEQAVQQQQQQPDPAMIELQIKAQEVKINEGRLMLEKQKLQFENTKNQQREAWEHEERMASNYARIQEAQASVLKAKLESDMEYMKLMQKKEAVMVDAQTKAQIAETSAQANIFIEGMKGQQKEIDQMLYEREMDLKAQTGEGV